jgi:hypothetical protein
MGGPPWEVQLLTLVSKEAPAMFSSYVDYFTARYQQGKMSEAEFLRFEETLALVRAFSR